MSNSTTKEKDLFTCNSYISLFIDEKNDWCLSVILMLKKEGCLFDVPYDLSLLVNDIKVLHQIDANQSLNSSPTLDEKEYHNRMEE